MREANVCERKKSIAGFYSRNTDLARSDKRMARDELLDDRHRTRRGFDCWWRDFAAETCLVVVEETTMRDDVLRNLIEAFGKFSKWNLLATSNTFDQTEIG